MLTSINILNSVIESISEIFLKELKSIDIQKWDFLRTFPYFEGWFQSEFYVCFKKITEYKVVGVDFPSVTRNPIPDRKSNQICPDMLFFSEKLNTFIWVELKTISLTRQLKNRKTKIGYYSTEIKNTWNALCGLSIDETIKQIPKNSEKSCQQLINVDIGMKIEDFICKIKNARHIITMVMIVTNFKEGIKYLVPKITPQNIICKNLFSKYPNDFLITFGEHLK